MEKAEKTSSPKVKRLVINKEALRVLTANELTDIVGGHATKVCTDGSTCDTTVTGCC